MSASAPGVPPLELSVPELVPAAELSLAQEQLAKLKSEHQKLREERDGYAAHVISMEDALEVSSREKRGLRSRLLWQRARLNVTLRKTKEALKEAWAERRCRERRRASVAI